ncbi:hypothetical protein EBB07_03075 [Paenibacillaceae bacterium]|nr:hypothetical protein EBB07_03075 [Paenibacillaceae bacterium]
MRGFAALARRMRGFAALARPMRGFAAPARRMRGLAAPGQRIPLPLAALGQGCSYSRDYAGYPTAMAINPAKVQDFAYYLLKLKMIPAIMQEIFNIHPKFILFEKK